MRIHKSALSLGVLAVSALALTLFAPRAAHAVAAALVQVTNTAANPAMAQDVNGQAAQQIDLICAVTTPGTAANCASFSPTATVLASPYVVPANQSLIVTAVDIQPYSASPSSCSAGTGTWVATNNAIRKAWFVFGTGTVHYEYPSGFVLGSGQTITQNVNQVSVCPASMELHGYLTSN
jgi:hypothetical protein